MAACGGTTEDMQSGSMLATTPTGSSSTNTAPGKVTSAGSAGTAAIPSSNSAASAGRTATTGAVTGTGAAGTAAAAGTSSSAAQASAGAAAQAGANGNVAAGSAGAKATGAAGTSAAQAGASAAGSSATASMGGFPRTAEEVNVKAKGPYMVKTYTDGLSASEYSSSVMYYPADAAPPFAGVALAPGFTASGTDYEFVGDMLASHGIAVLLTTPTDTDVDQPPARGEDLVAAVKHLQEENTRQGSPLMGKLATDRICVTGHSMGGGGSLYAANTLGNMIRCAVPLQPWQPGGDFAKITAPTLIVGAASDTIADVPTHSQTHYRSIPDSTEKFLVVFEGDHYLSTDRTSGVPQGMPAVANENYDLQAAYMMPFYKLFLEGDERYRPYLYGAMRSMQSVTSFEKSKMQ